MKYLISVLLCVLLLGCEDPNITYEERMQAVIEDKIIEFTYQGCEYLLMYGEGPSHKGNCSNSIHCYNKIED
jgi:hypothetical protein